MSARPGLGSLVAVATLVAMCGSGLRGRREASRAADRRNTGRETIGGHARGHCGRSDRDNGQRRRRPSRRADDACRAVSPSSTRSCRGRACGRARRRERRERHVPCFIADRVSSPAIGPRPPVRDATSGAGIAVGRLEHGRLRDPRLDLAGCRNAAADPVAFAWVEPGRATRYVTVSQPGFTEVYRVAAGLPVRITTTSGVDQERSRASFRITEHDGDGRLLRAYTLDARVAG